MKLDKKNISIQILAIIGIALTIELAIIYYNANYVQYGLSSFCSINNFVDCDGAARSNTAQFLGIPLAYWGLFFYLTILFLTFVDKLKNIKYLAFLEVFKEPKAYIGALGTIAFAISMILAGISYFYIKKICILCIITYLIDFIIALTATDGMFKNIIRSFKTTFIDFISGAKKYTKIFIILLITSISFLFFSGTTYTFVPHIKSSKDIMKYRKIKYNPYRVSGNILGNENADVVIKLYSDFVCPLCYIQNIMLHKAVKEYKNIKIEHINIPFDKTCNSNMEYNIHPKACFMSSGALAAKRQGNYWEMSSLLYENNPKSLKEMLNLAEKVNLDLEKFQKDITSESIKKELNLEITEANSLNIDATPTMFINGNKIVGVKPYYKLTKILEEYGAKRK